METEWTSAPASERDAGPDTMDLKTKQAGGSPRPAYTLCPVILTPAGLPTGRKEVFEMNMKTAVAAVCLVLLCSAAVVCISDDSDADVSPGDMIVVRNGDELAKAIRSTYTMNGDTPVPSPKNIIVASGIDTIVIDDSLMVSTMFGPCISEYFFGTFDGNGCTLKADLRVQSFLMGRIEGTSGLKNFHIEVNDALFSLAYDAVNATVLLENIVLDKYVTCGNNDSAFLIHLNGNAHATFRNCINNASYAIGTYSAVFLGGFMWDKYGLGLNSVEFDGCVNNGDIFGDMVYMFIGNGAHVDGTVTVKDCVNNGTFKGNKAAPFANFNGSGHDYAEENARYTAAVGGVFDPSSQPETLTCDRDTGDLAVVNATDGRTYEIMMMAYATAENGTYGMTATVPYIVGQTKAGWFVDVYTAKEKYGLDIDPEDFPAGEQYPWKAVTSSGGKLFYVFYFGEDTYEWNMDRSPSATMKIYEDGSLIWITASKNLDLSTPGSGYTTCMVTVPSSSCYSIELDTPRGNVVRSGNTLIFTVSPAYGYSITGVSAYYKEGGVTHDLTVADLGNGSYSCTVDHDITIVVGYEQIYYTVACNLVNVSSDNESIIIPGASLQAVLTPANGYEVGTIYVTHGSETYTVSGNIVFIPNVTGNVSISCIGTPVAYVPGDSDDDDSDDPMIPEQVADSGSSNDKTVVVACAAAAVAAAMIAAFLLIDGRKP